MSHSRLYSIPQDDLADLIVLLLLIGMDSQSTPGFLLEIAQVIDRLGQFLSSDPSLQVSLFCLGLPVGADSDLLVYPLCEGGESWHFL